jgi:isopentenyl diphosphate isomerase/L-lactate dehydrogenase-like FMN-dependent dehydrogenase
MAGPFIKAAVQSLDETILTIQEIQKEIQVAMFATGNKTLHNLADHSLNQVQK